MNMFSWLVARGNNGVYPMKKILLAFEGFLVIACLACGLYKNDYYHADDYALETLEHPAEGISVAREHNRIIFSPENPRAGLIFYPGGKVQYESYAPLMEACASQGLLCVLVHMPGNLAVFDMDAADGIPDEYPQVEDWYIGGHSLGGSMAAAYLGSHTEEYDGLILLASYSTGDLSGSALKVLAVYGSEDRVLNMDSYEKYRENLPEDFTEYVIPGGCHAFFGSYGAQKGDGQPDLTNEEQIRLTADMIGQWF